MSKPVCRVIIPALNEEKSIAKVLADIDDLVITEVVVVDNGSEDDTVNVARQNGATVLIEQERGYGAACLKGIEFIRSNYPETDIIVFLDGDYSDYPQEITSLIKPILDDKIDLVIGSRVLGQREKGSLTPVQQFGNWLSCKLILLFFNEKFTDLGPFRAIKLNRLLELGMKDRNYGWTVEMQVKAAKMQYNCTEVPVSYRNRIGKSKVSGTVKGSILAGNKILYTIFKNI
jgi:glycosyltransferase involved in cell wall biosynthesis